MAPSTWQMFQKTEQRFAEIVPDASSIEGSGQFELDVGGISETFRLKRGKDQVNQNHIHHGEPLVVHVPAEEDNEDGEWYVLPVRWLIAYALDNPDSRQHTVHALDCFMFSSSKLPPSARAEPDQLQSAIRNAIRDSREDEVTRAVRAIRRARVFSVTHFEEAADVASAALNLPVPNEQGA